LDLPTVDERLADLHARALAHHQHLIELDRIADRGVELFDTDTFALPGAILLTACAEYGVHVDDSWAG
jgi:hypothetical protein